MEEKDEVLILLVEDNEGHALLTKDLFKRVGIKNEIVHPKTGRRPGIIYPARRRRPRVA